MIVVRGERRESERELSAREWEGAETERSRGRGFLREEKSRGGDRVFLGACVCVGDNSRESVS